MRLTYAWHTEKEVGHVRSYLLFAKYLELMCTYNKVHVLLDCPSADLTALRIKHHHLFCTL